MVWQDELMKTLIAWPEVKERKECWNQSGNASETATHVEERGGGAADIKFQPRRATQTLPPSPPGGPDQTRRDALSEFGGDQGR